MNQFTTDYVGLDVHKESIDIAVASAGNADVRHLGKVAGDLNAVARALRRLQRDGRRLQVVYEAGPCLSGLGFECQVVAPSLVPKRSGERIKTDRRDSLKLARAARAGDLTAVRVPDAADEAMRDLSRAREDAVREQRNARHRLKALLLRNDVRYDGGKKSWTAAHQRWLSKVKLPHPAQQIAFQEYLHAIGESAARIDRLEQALREGLSGRTLAPVVEALQALRGVQLVAAMTLVRQLGGAAHSR